jgi:mono/diheme cytochrome c family protein
VRGVAVLVSALALVVAGCGGGEESSPAPETQEGTVATETTGGGGGGGGKGDAAKGKEIFTSQGCTSCHTLKAAGSTGTVGPNLDEAKPSFDKVVERVTNGKGVMPSFKDKLSTADINNVAAFVSQNAGKG